MKNFKFRLFFAAFVIAVSFSIAATEPMKEKFATYRYTSDSDDFGEMKDPSNWEVGTLSCPVEGIVPCELIYNGSDFASHLQSYASKGELLGDAQGQRTP